MGFQVKSTKKGGGQYALAFGKGNSKLLGTSGKDASGKWGVLIDATGDVLVRDLKTQRECKEAFGKYALLNYPGALDAAQSAEKAALMQGQQPEQEGPEGPHAWKDINPETGMNEAERRTSRESFEFLVMFAEEKGPIYFTNDPAGLELLQVAAADVRRLTLD